MKPNCMFVCIIVLVFSGSLLYGQEFRLPGPVDSTETYKLELTDKTVIIGNILRYDAEKVVMRTAVIPLIEIPFPKVKSFERIDKETIKRGVYWFPNPHPTRYLFGPSAFTLEKGEGYYQNSYLFLNSVDIGITDNISLGGGIEFISTFGSLAGGEFSPIFFLTPKVGFKVSETFRTGAGLLYINTPSDLFDNDRQGLGITYGMGTIGSPDHNLTGGLGWGFVGEDFADKPFIMVSGMTRMSRKTALVTENWFIPLDKKYETLLSYGIRFFGEKLSVDLAFLNNADIAESLIIGIPYIDFAVKF